MTFKRKSKLKNSQAKFITRKQYKKSSNNFISNEGRWSEEEHEIFLEGIVIYDIKWKKVKALIETRTIMQVRSNAQNFFYKMKACKDESLGIDFTSNKFYNINNNFNFNIINAFNI